MSNDKTAPDTHTGAWHRTGPPQQLVFSEFALPQYSVPSVSPRSTARCAAAKSAIAARRNRSDTAPDDRRPSRRVRITPPLPNGQPRGEANIDANRLVKIAIQVTRAVDEPAACDLLQQGAEALGAEQAAFISFDSENQDGSSLRFLLAFEHRWHAEFMAARRGRDDPWRAYATRHTDPIVGSRMRLDSPANRQVAVDAMCHGFVSALLVPAHAAPGHCRIGLLCLGTTRPGHFENDLGDLAVAGRMLAAQLHSWWQAQIRRELFKRVRLSANDLVLLTHEHQGHSSKHIARELQISEKSVNSRFQRLFVKLGVPNRRQAAKLAAECGLIQP